MIRKDLLTQAIKHKILSIRRTRVNNGNSSNNIKKKDTKENDRLLVSLFQISFSYFSELSMNYVQNSFYIHIFH